MRSCIITAVLALTLVACGSRMQQLASAGEKIKQCVNQCSLSSMPAGAAKTSDNSPVSVKDGDANSTQDGGGDRVQTIWSTKMKLW